MEFGWSSTQQELYDRAVAFARDRLQPAAGDGSAFVRDAWKLCGDFGLLGASVPERYGGLGLDALSTARLVEAFGRGCEDQGLLFSACAHLFACLMPIAERGEEPLKQRILPKLCSGEWIAANAITEAGAGSDVHALKTRAVRDGDRYRITGEKSYVTNGPVAEVFLVYASTAPENGYLGLTAFVVDRETPGLSVGKPFSKLGLRSSPISAVYLDDCVVPAAQRVGPEGAGAEVFRGSMHWERTCLFAGYVGGMERLLERTVQFARERKQFRKPIGRNQAISHRLADMKLRLESARLLLYRACWLMDQGQEAHIEVALAKIAISEAAVQAGIDAIQIHGGLGFMTETGIERALRDAVPSTIFSGTSEIQRDLVASRLGL